MPVVTATVDVGLDVEEKVKQFSRGIGEGASGASSRCRTGDRREGKTI